MNPQLEEHLRDSAPDNSRFDGFDRGDAGREADFDADAYPAEALAPEPSLASRLLARMGALRADFRQAVADQMPALPHFVQRSNPERNGERAACRELGKRQYRRLKCTSYALKREGRRA